jgi:DNA-binding response OmpR family regulator
MSARILIVDDEKEIVRLVRRGLEKAGYAVACASDAESALTLARKTEPSLIVLDVMLPAMNGLEFLRVLRRESEIPVILLSGRGADIDRIIGFKAGADDYLVKPFSMGELTARVEILLRRKKSPTSR